MTVPSDSVTEGAPDGGNRRSSTRSSLIGLASSLGVIAANLASGVITARLLGPEGRAVVITATVWLIVWSWIAMIGAKQSVAFFLAAEVEKRTPSVIASSALLLATVLSFVGLAVAQLSVGFVIDDPVLLEPTRWMLAIIVVVIWYEVLNGILLGQHRIGVAMALRTSQAVLYVLLVLVVAVASSLTAVLALVCLAFSFALPAVVSAAVIAASRGFGRPTIGAMREVLIYGARLYPGTLATLTNARIDLLVVPAVLTPVAVGYYGVATNTSSVMQQLLGNFALVLFPAMVSVDAARRRALLERTIRLLLLLGLGAAIIGSLVAHPVIRLLYGAEFDPTVPLLRVLLVAAVPYAVMGVIASGLAANGMPGRASLVNLVGVPATVVGLLLLVPDLGAAGAALTSLIAYALCMGAGLALSPSTLLSTRALLSPAAYRGDVLDLAGRVRRSKRRK